MNVFYILLLRYGFITELKKSMSFFFKNKCNSCEDKELIFLKLQLAKTLKENGISIDIIHKKTGLPIEEIEKL